MGIDLGSIFQMLRRRWWLFILLPIIGGLLGFMAGERQTPMYSATSTLMVTSRTGDERAQYQDVQLAQALATTYAEIVLTGPILVPVAEEHASGVTLEELQSNAAAGVSGGSLLSVSVANDDPNLAAALANDIATQAAKYSVGNPTIGGILSVAEFASVPTSPYAPRIPAYVVLGGVLGSLLAGGAAYTFDRLDTRHRAQRPTHNRRSLAIVPSVPRRVRAKMGIHTLNDPRTSAADSIRSVRAAILGTHADRETSLGRGQTVGFFAPETNTGQSAIVASLARSLANSGISTAVIDLNFLNPSIGAYFKINDLTGVAELLHSRRRTSWTEVAHAISPHLHVLLPGVTFANSVDILANPHLTRIISDVADSADIVLIDLPSADVSPELTLFARSIDTAVLVAREGRTQRDALATLASDLEQVDANILGVVTTFGRQKIEMRHATRVAKNANIRALEPARAEIEQRTDDTRRERPHPA